MSQRGFSLIELLLVITLMGLLLTLAMPRLSAFLARPEDRELRQLENFLIGGARRALRESPVPRDQPDAKPIRVKIVPPKNVVLLRADTELATFELVIYRIGDVYQDEQRTNPEPEFVFSPMGFLPSFTMELSSERPRMDIHWHIDRLGGVRVEPARS